MLGVGVAGEEDPLKTGPTSKLRGICHRDSRALRKPSTSAGKRQRVGLWGGPHSHGQNDIPRLSPVLG